MARTASFTSTGQTIPGGGMTLAALMARQKELADRKAAMATESYPGAGTIPGGLGHMANMFFTGLGESQARRSEVEGRQALAEAVARINPATGEAQPQDLATIMALDQDLGQKILAQGIEARRAAEAERVRVAERAESRGWDLSDAEKEAAAAVANREDLQAAAADTATKQHERTVGENLRKEGVEQKEADRVRALELEEKKRQEALAAAAPATEQGKIYSDYEKGAYGEPGTPAAIQARDDALKAKNTRAGGTQNLKDLYGQQDAYVNSSFAISNLKEARDLLKQGINWGRLEGVGLGGSTFGDDETRQRTKRYNQIMNAEAINQMAQQLSGATSNQEMAEFIKNMNDPTIDPTIKGQMIDTMVAKGATFQELQRARITELGGEVPAIQQAKKMSPEDEAASLEAARKKIATNPELADLVKKRLSENGIDPGKL